MTATLRVPRSRGALSGTLLVLLGLWGGLIPFIGPYADFAYTPDHAWVSTSGRLLLEVLPAVATVLGGLILLSSANRAIAMLGAWLAALGGAWFVVGTAVSTLWTSRHTPAAGSPVGSIGRQVAEQLAFFSGLGVAVLFFAALALGRLAVVGVRDAALSEPYVQEYDPAPGHEGERYSTDSEGAGPAAPPLTPAPGTGRYARPSGPETTPFPARPQYETQPGYDTSSGPADAPPPLPRRKRKQQDVAEPTDQKVAGHRTGE
ncbi:MAG: hypothetical protein JWL58_429 [Streptosporangiaceae bacterium]|jgi:hypothetical protein|nr:hypothetical protein [Streptosporangiaceae bacterium]